MERPKKRGRILIMDDDDSCREMLFVLLNHEGYDVVATMDGREALDYFERSIEEETPFDAVILDLLVPKGMGGLETVSEIRKLNETIPVIVASGYLNEPVMAAPEDYQFTAGICKPFRPAQILAKVEYHVQNTMAIASEPAA